MASRSWSASVGASRARHSGSEAMLETPGPPLDITIALTAGPSSVWGVNTNAIGIVGLLGLERSSETATVPHFAAAAAPAGHFPKTAVGAALATPGSASTTTVTRTAKRPGMPRN